MPLGNLAAGGEHRRLRERLLLRGCDLLEANPSGPTEQATTFETHDLALEHHGVEPPIEAEQDRVALVSGLRAATFEMPWL